METTIDPGLESARQGLRDSLSKGVDFSDYKMPDIDPGPSSSDATLNKPAEETQAAEPRGDSVESDTQTSSQPAKEGTTQEETATNRTEAPKQTKAPPRIQQLLDQVKAKEARIAELERTQREAPKQEDKKEPPKPLVPQPTPPQYTRELLAQLEDKAIAAGDEVTLRQVRKEQEAWNRHDLEMVKWEMKNGEAVKTHNSHVQFYKQEALKKWPALADANSEHAKAYTGIRGWISNQLPHLLEAPVSEHLLAQIGEWRVNSGRLVAVESELKKVREELGKAKKDGQPLTTTVKAEVGGKSDDSLEDAKSNLKQALRSTFGSNTMPG